MAKSVKAKVEKKVQAKNGVRAQKAITNIRARLNQRSKKKTQIGFD